MITPGPPGYDTPMKPFAISHVPDTVLEKFVELGAVSAGMIKLVTRNYYSGREEERAFDDIVHFFNVNDVEIGYWSVLQKYCGDRPTLFENGRMWSKSFLDGLYRYDLYLRRIT